VTESSVIDTNVLEVADGRHEKADAACVDACIEALEEAKTHIVLLDEGRLIDKEYRRHFERPRDQGSPGHSFFKWLQQNIDNPDHCRSIALTPRGRDGDFEEFPDGEDLRGFDLDDRKFVAVALASKMDPEILNASDTDWRNYRDALESRGVRIRFLCPDLMERDRPPCGGRE